MREMLENIRQDVNDKIAFLHQIFPALFDIAKSGDKKALQVNLEKALSKSNLLNIVADNVLTKNDEHREALKNFCEQQDLDMKLVRKTVAELALHRRMTLSMLFGTLSKSFKGNYEELGAFLKKLTDLKFIHFLSDQGVFVPNDQFQMTSGLEFALDLMQSNPCCVAKPKKIKNIKGRFRNGYLNLNRGIWSKKAEEHTDAPVDFLDMQNHLPYKINYSAWDHYIFEHPEIPEQEDDEDDYDYQKKVKEAWRHHAKKTFIIELFRELGIETIYILNMYDYRGRNYPISYLFNPQGRDLDKALLAFDPQPITEEGIKWLAVSIANCYNDQINGVDADKCVFSDRLKWYEENVMPKLDLPSNEFIQWLNLASEHADSPACFWSQCHNMWWIRKNQKEGTTPMSWAITHWDATASGYQLQAIFAKDWEMARMSNLIDPDKRLDLYTLLYQELTAKGLPETYSRTQVKKKGFIPAVYNSTNSIKELFTNEDDQKIFFKTMHRFAMWRMNRMFPSLWDSSWTEYTWKLPDGFRVYDKISYTEYREWEYEGHLFTVAENVVGPQKFSLKLGPNITHSCDGFFARELARRLNFKPGWKKFITELRNDPSKWTREDGEDRKIMEELLALGKEFNFYSVRILKECKPSNVDLIPDEVFEHLLSELPENPCIVSEIHDSFGVCPNYATELMKQYRILCRDLAASQFLPVVIRQLKGEDDSRFFAGRDDSFVEAIANSGYALC